MQYRSLGRTGVKVSALCLGCMNFGFPTPEDEALTLIDYALDQGINFLDTANVYNRGRSEEIVGKALRRNGKRDRIVLATKVHGRMDDNDVLAEGNNRRHIIAQCEASLRRLQTDYIDLYQIHRPESEVPIDETLRALDNLIHAGKVRYIGTSTYPAWQVIESLWVSHELGLNRFVTEQPPYHLLDRSIERELVPLAQSYGLAILPWSPLARGFLSGKYRRGQDIPGDSRVARDMQGPFAERTRKHFSDLAFNVLDEVEAFAREKSCTPSQIALAWCMNQPGITSPIIGPRTLDQLKDNLGATGVSIGDADRARLDTVSEPEQAIVLYYSSKMIDFKPPQYRW
ncbi:MAG TPA: aldo/keto reductase [Aggregatilineales bacterium]|nr:aldo/keto reductase [Aggregatilineales bacterium]